MSSQECKADVHNDNFNDNNDVNDNNYTFPVQRLGVHNTETVFACVRCDDSVNPRSSIFIGCKSTSLERKHSSVI
jgi:hypothetical protein